MANSPDRDFVRVGRSRIHGQGLFARRTIPRGTRIIEYAGERVPLARLLAEAGAGPAAVYTFRLNEWTVIDGSRGGNEARLINHSCAPNCEACGFDERMFIYALRDIARGEELTFDYQLRPALDGRRPRLEDAACRCRCGSPGCRGTMLSGRRHRSPDRRRRLGVSSASVLAASLLAAPLGAVPGVAWAPGSRVAAGLLQEPANLRLKFADVYVKLPERFAIVGLDDTHPVYRNARGEFFFLDPATGDFRFLSPDFYSKFGRPTRVVKGIPVKALKLDPSKYGGQVSLLGIDARGNVVQKNRRGEIFYLDPVTGDMVFVK